MQDEPSAPGPDDPADQTPRPAPIRDLVETALKADPESRAYKITRTLRGLLPGDEDLGDPLSTSSDKPSHQIARRVATAGAKEQSAARELSLGALQVWQAFSEVQGRGRGDLDLAILFTDLVDFSEWALEAGDEAVIDLLRRVSSVTETAVTAHRGRTVKHLGDGLMAVFLSADAAVDAACEATAAVGALECQGYTPQMRAGVHIGRPRKLGGDYIGVDVNIAARVAQAASGGEVLVSGPACGKLDEEAYTRKRLRRFKAKGAPKDLEVYAVSRA